MTTVGESKSQSVPTGKIHRFVLGPNECSELAGPHFDFDRTFIRPEGMAALGVIAATMRSKPRKKAAIFGHTDTVGDEIYNKRLSEQRARVVLAALTHDTAPWEERYQTEHWGPRTVQVILNAVQPGGDTNEPLDDDGLYGPLTKAAVERFQQREGLFVDGDAGPATRKQLFLAYMKLSIEQPVDGGQMLQIGGAKFMGCGEYNPFTEGVADDASRRVVVILFSPALVPQGLPCKIGNIGPCRSNLRAADAPPISGDKTPHFRCQVYRGISVRCPCGPGVELVPFRLQIHDERYTPCGDVEYRLKLASGSVVHGKTDAKGWLNNAVPKGKQVVTVSYTPAQSEDELSLKVRLTDADPSSDDALLCHLFNIGFADETDDDRAMILRFQGQKQLQRSGTLDDSTKAAIRKIFDGGDDALDAELGDSR